MTSVSAGQLDAYFREIQGTVEYKGVSARCSIDFL